MNQKMIGAKDHSGVATSDLSFIHPYNKEDKDDEQQLVHYIELIEYLHYMLVRRHLRWHRFHVTFFLNISWVLGAEQHRRTKLGIKIWGDWISPMDCLLNPHVHYYLKVQEETIWCTLHNINDLPQQFNKRISICSVCKHISWLTLPDEEWQPIDETTRRKQQLRGLHVCGEKIG